MSQNKLAKVAALLVQLGVLLSGACASERRGGELTVRVIDQVGVPEKEWRVAEQFADRVYRAVGVSITWVHCLSNPAIDNTDCRQRTAPNELTMIVVSEQSALRLQISPRVFGVALAFSDGSFASRGYISYGRIQTKCGEHHDVSEALLLGAVVAHELGHLLLGPNSHSPNGIMKPDLELDDMTGINLSALDFDRGQREALRNAVARRLEAAHSQGTNTNLFVAEAAARSDAR